MDITSVDKHPDAQATRSPTASLLHVVVMDADPEPEWLPGWRDSMKRSGTEVLVQEPVSLLPTLAADPAARALVIVSSPSRLLARRALASLRACRPVDTEAVTAKWLESARQISPAALLGVGKCLFTSEEDLFAEPLAWASVLGKWFGGPASWATPDTAIRSADLALAQRLAESKLSAVPRLARQYEELLAFCQIVPGAALPRVAGADDAWQSWYSQQLALSTLHAGLQRTCVALQLGAAIDAPEATASANRAGDSHLGGGTYSDGAGVDHLGVLTPLLDLIHRRTLDLLTEHGNARRDAAAAALALAEESDRSLRLQQEAGAAAAALTLRHAELEALRQCVADSEARAQEATDAVNRLQEDLDAGIRRLFATQQELEQALAICDQVEPLRTELGRQAAEIAALTRCIEQLEERLASANSELQRQTETADTLRQTLLEEQTRAGHSEQQHQAEFAALQGRVREQSLKLEEQKAEYDGLLNRLFAAQEDLERALVQCAELEPLHAENARQETEITALLAHMHDLQAEVERFAFREMSLQGPSGLLHHQGPARLQARSVEHQDERLDGSHRHLTSLLKGVTIDGQPARELKVRLVEHQGRPGWALFKPMADAALLGGWAPSGTEGDAEYMLVVPSDEAGQRALAPLGTGDWHLMLDLVAVLVDSIPSSRPHWQGVAARLCRHLAASTRRFRYDGIDVSSADETGRSLRAVFHRPSFGQRCDGRLELVWSADGECVKLLAGEGSDGPPLAGWPVDAGGGMPSEWQLPVGKRCNESDKRRSWAALPVEDRVWLTAVLDALPAVAEVAKRQRAGSATENLMSVDKAVSLHREARRIQSLLALRQKFSRVVNRNR